MNKIRKNLDFAAGIIAIVLGVLLVIPAVRWIIFALQFLTAGYPIVTLLLQIVSLAVIIVVLINGIKTVIKPGAGSKKFTIINIVFAGILLILNIAGRVSHLAVICAVLFYPMVICIAGQFSSSICVITEV